MRREAKAHGAAAFAAARCAWGAEGSVAGLPATVPGAGDKQEGLS